MAEAQLAPAMGRAAGRAVVGPVHASLSIHRQPQAIVFSREQQLMPLVRAGLGDPIRAAGHEMKAAVLAHVGLAAPDRDVGDVVAVDVAVGVLDERSVARRERIVEDVLPAVAPARADKDDGLAFGAAVRVAEVPPHREVLREVAPQPVRPVPVRRAFDGEVRAAQPQPAAGLAQDLAQARAFHRPFALAFDGPFCGIVEAVFVEQLRVREVQVGHRATPSSRSGGVTCAYFRVHSRR